jgi:uncharacterized membrane protein (UPF0136 family)
MHTQVYRKILFHLSLFGVVFSILVAMYDVIFHFLLESLHIIFEMVESSLDELVEHFFHTELHETQLIVFYILLVVGGIIIYLAWKALVHLFSGASQNFNNEWTDLRAALNSDWQRLSMTERVVWITLFLLANYLLSFLLF